MLWYPARKTTRRTAEEDVKGRGQLTPGRNTGRIFSTVEEEKEEKEEKEEEKRRKRRSRRKRRIYEYSVQ